MANNALNIEPNSGSTDAEGDVRTRNGNAPTMYLPASSPDKSGEVTEQRRASNEVQNLTSHPDHVNPKTPPTQGYATAMNQRTTPTSMPLPHPGDRRRPAPGLVTDNG